MALLEIFGLTVSYGQTRALTDVALTVEEGQIVTVLGANGAGKSSLLRAIIGDVRPSKGQILFKREELVHLRPSERVRRGVVLVPEGRRILTSMTIEENLLLGAHMRADRRAVAREIAGIYERFPNLGTRKDMAAACLSGGEQQMLAIGRALLAHPALMMLDEPSLGLSPLFVEKLFGLIRELHDGGLTILLVEQNAGKALQVADAAMVLELGRVAVRGAPQTLMHDERLRQAYLGGA